MFFKKRTPAVSENPRSTLQRTTADTAHLVGPGCVKLVGSLPVWNPVQGDRLQLHPQYLRRILCYGNVDLSSAVLRLLWRKGVQVVFLSPAGNALLGKLQPSGGTPNLPRLQHLAAANAGFCLQMGREIVLAKIQSQIDATRYYQRQGKGSAAGDTIRLLMRQANSVSHLNTSAALLGAEGTASAAWFSFLASLIPSGWDFRKRVARPARDPVNALLSLGYSLAHYRCETLLAAADLDPRVGFLHELRPGRSSLACDLVEPLRAPLVDRMVLAMLARTMVKPDSFTSDGKTCRLRPDDFKHYLATFEQHFADDRSNPGFRQQTLDRIERWSKSIRQFHSGPGEIAS